VNIRNPERISFDSRDSSSKAGSVSGFFGSSHAVTMVVRDEINGPVVTADDGCGRPGEHAARARSAAAETDK